MTIYWDIVNDVYLIALTSSSYVQVLLGWVCKNQYV
jgi:hypothetical protein